MALAVELLKERIKNLTLLKNDTLLEELSNLDIACKSLIRNLLNEATLFDSNALYKIQGVLDYTYERINIGDWRQVPPELRKTMTVASYLKLQCHLAKTESVNVTEDLVRESFKIIDYGLLFGKPLTNVPRLLQACASIITEASETVSLIKTVHSEITEVHKPSPDGYLHSLSGTPVTDATSPSMEDFYNNYFKTDTPVVLNNCISHWPALTKWQDPNYFLKLVGMRTVPIELGSKYTDTEWTQKLMTVEEFIKEHIQEKNNTTGYLAQYQLFEQIPELHDDIYEPDYCCFTSTDSEQLDINAWYGPKGTVSPLHYDIKHNLLCQVIGEKKIFLFSHTDSKYLYPHDDDMLCNTARVDPRCPDLEKFPEFKNAKMYHCILKPGQMLYIPPKWWHFVESLSVSFSVSFWWT